MAHASSERASSGGRLREVAAKRPEVPVRVYRLRRPWTNRDLATLRSLGLREGVGYSVEHLAALRRPVPDGTRLVIISSNSYGLARAARIETSRAVQQTLTRFLHGGGVVIGSLADNLRKGGFTLPKATGTPDAVFPNCRDATLTGAAIGPDGLRRTADDHPLVRGPDGVAGTRDDLSIDRIDLTRHSCAIAHGNLVDGIDLPKSTTFLMSATFDGRARPVLGEYCVGRGRVLASTLTLEFSGQRPAGGGPSLILRNLFAYALTGSCHGS